MGFQACFTYFKIKLTSEKKNSRDAFGLLLNDNYPYFKEYTKKPCVLQTIG